jgi:hypothetical protein
MVLPWGGVVQVVPTLTPDQRRYLTRIAQSSCLISGIEYYVNSGREFFSRWVTRYSVLILTVLVAGTVLLVVLHSLKLLSGYEYILVVIGLYMTEFILVYVGRRRYTLGRAGLDSEIFGSLVRCMSSIDGAMGSAPVSAPRIKVVKQLSRSARIIERYSPLIPVGQYRRILAQEAIRAREILRQLSRPIMLGTDKDLKEVKEALAHAAIQVGIKNWVEVSNLETSSITPSIERRAVYSALLPLITGIVIPIIAALITVLVKP